MILSSTRSPQEIAQAIKSRLGAKGVKGLVCSPTEIEHPVPVSAVGNVIYQGVEYTKRELAKHLGISHSTLNIKMAQGMEPDDIVADVVKHRSEITKYEYKGEIYGACDLVRLPESKVNRRTFQVRMQRGWDVETALTTPVWAKKGA